MKGAIGAVRKGFGVKEKQLEHATRRRRPRAPNNMVEDAFVPFVI